MVGHLQKWFIRNTNLVLICSITENSSLVLCYSPVSYISMCQWWKTWPACKATIRASFHGHNQSNVETKRRRKWREQYKITIILRDLRARTWMTLRYMFLLANFILFFSFIFFLNALQNYPSWKVHIYTGVKVKSKKAWSL